MSTTATNVSVGKPKVGGAIWVAPLGTTLPTTADGALNAAFKSLGYMSEDGVTNSLAPDSDTIKAWGGDVVVTTDNGRDDNTQFTMIEAKNLDVLKVVFGTGNVTGTLASGVTIKSTNDPLPDMCYVIDMIMRGNTIKRYVIPDGKVTDVADVVYRDSDAIGYGVTIQSIPDSEGVLHYEYMKEAASNSSTP